MKCRVCGTELEDGIKKCSVCGTVVDADGSLNEAMSSISSLAKALRSDREKMSQKLKPEESKKETNIEDLYVKNVDYTPEIIETDDNFDINAFYEETKDIDDDQDYTNTEADNAQTSEEENDAEYIASDQFDTASNQYDDTDNATSHYNTYDDTTSQHNTYYDTTSKYEQGQQDFEADEPSETSREIREESEENDNNQSSPQQAGGFTLTFDNGESTETYNIGGTSRGLEANNNDDQSSPQQAGGFTLSFDNGESTETYNFGGASASQNTSESQNNQPDDYITGGYLKETDFQSGADQSQQNFGNNSASEQSETSDNNSDTFSFKIEPTYTTEDTNTTTEDTGAAAGNNNVQEGDTPSDTASIQNADSSTPLAKIEPVKVPASEANQPFNFVVPGGADTSEADTTATASDNAEDGGTIKAENIPYTQLPEVKSSVSDTNPIVINPKDVVDKSDKASGGANSDKKDGDKKKKIWGVLSLVMMIIAGLGCIVLFGYILFLQNMTDANAVFQFIIDLFANASTLAYFAIGVLAAEIIAVIFAIIQIIVGSGKFAQLVLIFNALILIAMCVGMYLTKTFSLILSTLGIA